MLDVKEFDQIRWMGSASKCLQFLSNDTGTSSGPAAAEGFMSSIASIISSFENWIISSTRGLGKGGASKVADSISVFGGSLNTLLNCRWRIFAICFGQVAMFLFS